MRYKCPLIVVKDITRSRRFYENVLGQKVKLDFGENVTFEGDFAIHLEAHYLKLLRPGDTVIRYGGHDSELYFESVNLEELEARLTECGATFVHQIREQPWKQRVLRFHDPDQHIIEVGEPMETVVTRLRRQGSSEEQIKEATSLPAEFIRAVLH